MRTGIAIMMLALAIALLHCFALHQRIVYLEKMCASEYYRGAFETANAFADGTARILTNCVNTASGKEVSP